MATEESEEIEITEALITRKSYPIIWLGENGYNIARYGKLLKVKPSYYKDEEEMNIVIPTIDFEATYFIFKPSKWYIVAGGVNPDLLLVRDIIYANYEDIEKIIYDDLDLPANAKFQFASGIKRKGYGVIYEQVSSDIFEPLELKEGKSVIGKHYPHTFKVFKQGGKLFIKYIPPKDC